MAKTTFSGPVQSNNGFIGGVTLTPYTVASIPAATGRAGEMAFVSNGAAGAPVVAFSDGTDWLRVDTRAAISAS